MVRIKGAASKRKEARVKNTADNVSALQLKALCEQMNEISDFLHTEPPSVEQTFDLKSLLNGYENIHIFVAVSLLTATL